MILAATLASCKMPVEDFQFKNGDLLFSVGKGESELLKAAAIIPIVNKISTPLPK